MRLPFYSLAAQACLGLAALAGLAHPAIADEQRAQRVPLSPQYRQECAACHIAYPPGMLPAASWQRLMNGLPRHFGTDASLDPESVRQLAGWLGANAGNNRRVREAPPEDRITRSSWFVREHDEVAASTWQRPAIRSASNCIACHTRSDQGDFNEHDVRIPR
jgi:mono/diheme cytochrome c family protein